MTDLYDVDHNTKTDRPRDRGPLPAGWYLCKYAGDEKKVIKSGKGNKLSIEFHIDPDEHPEYEGRRIFTDLNLWNPSAEATRIAKGELTAIYEACGFQGQCRETDVMVGKRLAVKVVVKRNPQTGDDYNEIRRFDKPTKFVSQRGPQAESQQLPSAPPDHDDGIPF